MTWEMVSTRVRAAILALRARFDPRLAGRVVVGLGAFGMLGVGAEAAFRAELGPAEARLPTAFYSRPEPWGGDGEGEPMPIGSIASPILERRAPVRRSEVPDHLVAAILAVEDQRFFRHDGLDVKRIGGALVANLRAGAIVQGGSTITQQLAKNLYLSAERSPLRKVREAAIASVLEARYDKATILDAYLNEIYLGQDGARAIHGVGAAARYYFGKSVNRLSLAESALLAGMIHAPNRTNPLRHERAARRRRNLVLDLMAEQGRVSRKSANQGKKARIATRANPEPMLDARYFRDLALASVRGGLPSRGGAVYTTIDPALQRAAVRAVRDGLARFRSPDAQAALVAIDPRTGEVLALVGGRDYGRSQFNRAVEARRQPGSAFKPIVLLTALQRDGNRGPAFTLASRVEDEPFSVGRGATRWEPTNYDGNFRGEVTLREAIEQSLNVPFARVGLEVGPERIAAMARRLGIESPIRPVPSIAIGSSEVSLLELVRAYGVFATGGRLAATRTVLGRGAVGGAPPRRLEVVGVPVIDPPAAYLVTSALEGVIARGTGRGLAMSDRFGSLAGKTGTSNGWRDAWFVAYSPSIVVGVWVGFDDGRSIGLSGGDAALPIVARFLDRTEPEDRWASFPVPEGIEVARVGGSSGWSWGCGEREVFLEGTAPDSECDGFDSDDWDREWDRDRDDDAQWHRQLQTRQGRVVARLLERLFERSRREGRDDEDEDDDDDDRSPPRLRARLRP